MNSSIRPGSIYVSLSVAIMTASKHMYPCKRGQYLPLRIESSAHQVITLATLPDTCIHSQWPGYDTLPDNGKSVREDLGQHWSPFTAQSMAAPIPMPIFPLPAPSSGSNSHKLHPYLTLANSSNWWSHTSMISNTSPQDCYQFHHQIELQRHPHSIIRFGIDPFRINSSSIVVLPPNYPRHLDSIRTELYSQQMLSYDGSVILMLQSLRQKTISAYRGNTEETPSMFSYAKANHHLVPAQFGVSAPRSQFYNVTSVTAAVVREYRLRQCWGGQQPPPQQEPWKHGHCAENQSLPSVVAWCEYLDLENVVIGTLAVDKSGKFVGMCKNCLSYVYFRILGKHPTWKVFDICTGNIFQVNH